MRDEMGTTELLWTNTPESEIEIWMELNKAMDGPETRKGYKLLPLSLFWNTVVYMNPSSATYLLYCQIDEALQLEQRGSLYNELGAYIRGRGVRPHYLTRTYKQSRGFYYNFHLRDDPCYGVEVHKKNSTVYIELEEMSEAVREKVLALPYGTLTAILQNAYYFYASSTHTMQKEDEWFDEIPWYLIRWADVVQFYDSSIDTKRAYDDLAAFYEEKTDETESKLLRKLFHHRTRKLDLLPYLLAGEVLPRPTAIDLECKGLDSLGSQFILVFPDDGALVPKIPHFHSFWDLFLTYIEGLPTKIDWQEPGRPDTLRLFHLLVSTKQAKYYPVVGKRSTKSLTEGLWEMMVVLASGTRRRVFLDSTDYEVFCETLYDFLGPRTLEVIATHLLNVVEDKHNKYYVTESERKRAILFATVALNVISSVKNPSYQPPKSL